MEHWKAFFSILNRDYDNFDCLSSISESGYLGILHEYRLFKTYTRISYMVLYLCSTCIEFLAFIFLSVFKFLQLAFEMYKATYV